MFELDVMRGSPVWTPYSFALDCAFPLPHTNDRRMLNSMCTYACVGYMSLPGAMLSIFQVPYSMPSYAGVLDGQHN